MISTSTNAAFLEFWEKPWSKYSHAKILYLGSATATIISFLFLSLVSSILILDLLYCLQRWFKLFVVTLKKIKLMSILSNLMLINSPNIFFYQIIPPTFKLIEVLHHLFFFFWQNCIICFHLLSLSRSPLSCIIIGLSWYPSLVLIQSWHKTNQSISQRVQSRKSQNGTFCWGPHHVYFNARSARVIPPFSTEHVWRADPKKVHPCEGPTSWI